MAPNFVMLNCKICGRPFSFSTADAETFRRRNWLPPWRCQRCRDEARRREEEQGARSVDPFAAYDARRLGRGKA